MTREGLEKHWVEVEAFKDGATIQWKPSNRREEYKWITIDDPQFCEDQEYRVKPQAHTRTLWVNIYNDPSRFHFNHKTREDADKVSGTTRVACIPITLTWTDGEGLDKE